MKNKNIVLIGFMGVGKSLVSKILGETLKKEVYSTDDWIERKEGLLIKDIFAQKGEELFRQMEQDAVSYVAGLKGVIIDCGGGIPINPLNMQHLKETGVIFYLEAKPQTILNNIQGQAHRPLLNTENPKAKIEELMARRHKFYQQADYTIDSDNRTGHDIAADILKILNK